ncbi:unnamed protein product [Peniophora sp. CBMAI 1063]|nr:unnamed protein product [Peniophora sp. CBMAI 1063]
MENALSEHIQDSWMSFLYSQIDNRLVRDVPNSSLDISDKRMILSKHLASVRTAENLLCQHLNFLLPVYRLPDEILAHIMKYACSEDASLPYLPTRLMSVSRRWCAVVRSFAEIWAYPPIPDSQACIEAALSRDRSVPLHLRWHISDPSMSRSLEDNAFDLYTPTCGSITLSATSANLQAILFSLGSVEAPVLEYVSVEVDLDDREDPNNLRWPPNLFQGATPRLRDLNIYDFACVNWSDALFSSTLRKLDVRLLGSDHIHADDLTDDAGLSFQGLIDALDRLPWLEELVLSRCVSTSLLYGPRTSERTADLQHLDLLAIMDDPESCSLLVEALVIGTHTLVAYTIFDANEHLMGGKLGPFLRSRVTECFHNLDIFVSHEDEDDDSRRIDFFFHNGELTVAHMIVGAVVNIEPGLTPDWYRDLWTTMSASLDMRHVWSIRISLDSDAAMITKPMWLKAFAHASQVVRVICVESRQVPSLSHALCHHQKSSERKVLEQLFPRLAAVCTFGTMPRDVFLLKRALNIRRSVPGGRALGYFLIDCEPALRRITQARAQIVCVYPDGKRVPWFAPPRAKRTTIPGQRFEGFDVRRAVKAMRSKQRAKKLGKPPRLSATEHRSTLEAEYEIDFDSVFQ